MFISFQLPLPLRGFYSTRDTMFTIGDVPALSAAKVSELILAEQNVATPTYTIVDVRDGGECRRITFTILS